MMWTRLRKAAGEDAPKHTLLYCCSDIIHPYHSIVKYKYQKNIKNRKHQLFLDNHTCCGVK